MTNLPSTTDLLHSAIEALGGTQRPGQIAMAEAITTALNTPQHLVVQAGTGTGKSLAYLVPAIRYAHENNTTVIISTATLALQNQLVSRDIPRLIAAVRPHLQKEPTYAILKGRHNYICERKLAFIHDYDDPAALVDTEELTPMGAHVTRLYQWAETTRSGDRDDLNPNVPDILWQQVSSTSAECIGANRCEFADSCFAERSRSYARTCDIVITNHTLLALNATNDISILPEHSAIIIDEAHELDSRITAVNTTELSAAALSMSAKRAAKLGAGGRDEKLLESISTWETSMLTLPEGRLTSLPEEFQPTLTALQGTIWSLRDYIARTPEQEATHDPARYAERIALTRHLEQQHDSIVSVLKIFHEPNITLHDDVVWVVADEHRGVMLKIAPLSVAPLLRTQLFDATPSVILTSATLSLGGKFHAMAAQWGIPPHTWNSLDVGTPFTPRQSGILYVPQHLPEPHRDGLGEQVLDEIYDLIMAAGGRTLGLFSSRRAATYAADIMRTRLPFDVLCQGDDTTSNLVHTFAQQENTCLFGTLSLWQGVDVPGKSCSLVIMDKIPFPRPDDPLLQARKEAADRKGRNGFMEVAAHHAALLLAQGAGRLLRSADDKGVVAVLDRRLVEKRYGGFLLASMPALWRTRDKNTVMSALHRLVG